MKILIARDLGKYGYYYSIHLDETKVIPNPLLPKPVGLDTRSPVPDPEFVRVFEWGADVAPVDAMREMKLSCDAELERIRRTPMTSRKMLEEGRIL